jgi:hypothetical protein
LPLSKELISTKNLKLLENSLGSKNKTKQKQNKSKQNKWRYLIMFAGKGYNLSDIAAVTGGNRNDGMFGDNGWWIILLFLFAGWGRGFGGGFFGGEGGGMPGLPCATQADVRAAVDQ